MRVRSLTLKQIGEYFAPKHLLRPVSASTVTQYASLMEGGTQFPAIKLGSAPNPDPKAKQKTVRLIIDGVHIFKALGEAKVFKHACEFTSYNSLAEALADQLKCNLHHGLQVAVARRDARIRELIQTYKWKVREVAKAVGMHYASVSRINRNLQNVGGKGRRTARAKQCCKQ